MYIKPFKDFKTVVYCVFFFGIILDTFTLYEFWLQIQDVLKIKTMLENYGAPVDEIALKMSLKPLQNVMGVMLILFLVWDYVAYFFFLKYREWARKYVLSIAVFYIFTCCFDFSIIQFLYGVFTCVYIFGAREIGRAHV